MRRLAGVATVAVLLLAGCTAPGRPSTTPPTSTCVGDQAATTEVLNLNATPPREINGSRVAVKDIAKDDKGLWADLIITDAAGKSVTISHVTLDRTIPVGTGQVQVTHICLVEGLPANPAPGTSRGTVGLAVVK